MEWARKKLFAAEKGIHSKLKEEERAFIFAHCGEGDVFHAVVNGAASGVVVTLDYRLYDSAFMDGLKQGIGVGQSVVLRDGRIDVLMKKNDGVAA